ncbi:MAG: very short patch repair endonuclease [Thiogranum sp.]
MTDVVDRETRSRMMSGIRGKNTRPELVIREALFAKGLRYRLHVKDLPGKPDLVFPKYKAVIFIHGCFWHHHDCHLFKWPSTRPEFWKKKIDRNVEVDKRNYAALKAEKWRILTVWECAIKGKTKLCFESVIDEIVKWLKTENKDKEIEGKCCL